MQVVLTRLITKPTKLRIKIPIPKPSKSIPTATQSKARIKILLLFSESCTKCIGNNELLKPTNYTVLSLPSNTTILNYITNLISKEKVQSIILSRLKLHLLLKANKLLYILGLLIYINIVFYSSKSI